MCRLLRTSLCVSILLAVSAGRVGAETLYDAGLGGLPASQGWTYLTDPLFGASATQTLGSGFTELDTTPATGESAGYFSLSHPGVPVLDRVSGYTVGFEVRIDAENHGGNDRAGFSVIAIGDDTSSADARIELVSIEVLTGTAIPEPSSALLVVLAGLLAVAFRGRAARLKYPS